MNNRIVLKMFLGADTNTNIRGINPDRSAIRFDKFSNIKMSIRQSIREMPYLQLDLMPDPADPRNLPVTLNIEKLMLMDPTTSWAHGDLNAAPNNDALGILGTKLYFFITGTPVGGSGTQYLVSGNIEILNYVSPQYPNLEDPL